MTVGAITLATTRSPNPSSQKIQKKKELRTRKWSERRARINLRSRGMNTSTTFPYLSKSGNRSSAVVPEPCRGHKKRSIHVKRTRGVMEIPRRRRIGEEREREREEGADTDGRRCWGREESRCQRCPADQIFRSETSLAQLRSAVVFGGGGGEESRVWTGGSKGIWTIW